MCSCSRIPALAALLLACALMLATTPAAADYVMIDDFDDLVPGPIADQNDWRAPGSGSLVVVDPADAENLVLSVSTASTYLSHAALIPADADRMLFLRFRYEQQLNVSFGMSDQTLPFEVSDFDVELGLTSSSVELRINEGGDYTDLTGLASCCWYNCWLRIDNTANVTAIWLHDRPGERATEADRISVDGRDEFPFRGYSPDELKNFFIKAGGGDGVNGPFILDDLYLQDEDGLDLRNPSSAMVGNEPPDDGPAALPGALSLRGAWPNPFNPSTTIAYDLDLPQAVTLTVHDAGGRLVRRLVDDVRAAGPHATVWDGRDDAGRALPSGVYLAQLRGRRDIRSLKLVLTR